MTTKLELYKAKFDTPFEIMVTLFNTKTLSENRRYLSGDDDSRSLALAPSSTTVDHSRSLALAPSSTTVDHGNRIKCAYSSNQPITFTIPHNRFLIILEANVDTNQIEGIGVVKNKDTCKQIYENAEYNQYTYVGKYHIAREEWSAPQKRIMLWIEEFCFKGKAHIKRYSGIRRFPQKWIDSFQEKNINLHEFFQEMFKLFRQRRKQQS
jgi:hypothetical protein